MDGVITFLISGFVFGLSGGVSPGPLLMLLISESLRHGVAAGIKVAVAPLITDLPIVLGTLFLVAQFSDINFVLGGISIGGAVFLTYLGYESLTFKGVVVDGASVKSHSLRRGIVVNLLNPSPYLFWFSVGAPTIIRASEVGTTAVILFVVAMYVCLVGAKIIIALLIGKSKSVLKNTYYIYLIRGLGMALVVFAILFLKNGVQLIMNR